jgi:hypothetical protein
MIDAGQSKKPELKLCISMKLWLHVVIIIGTHFLSRKCYKLEYEGNLEIYKRDRAPVT